MARPVFVALAAVASLGMVQSWPSGTVGHDPGRAQVVLVAEPGDMDPGDMESDDMADQQPYAGITDEQMSDAELCTAAQEEAAGDIEDEVEVCAAKRTDSATARFDSAPQDDYAEYESITPYQLKGDVGVAPQTRKNPFNMSYLAASMKSLLAVCAYTTGKGGGSCGDASDDICFDRDGAESDTAKGLDDYLAKKRGMLCGEGSDSDLPEIDREVKQAALLAYRQAKTAAVNVESRIESDKAEAWAVQKWRAAGWLD
ncbi:hypothetical protein DMB37_18585 [Nocardia sp. CS682]|nr:hypothetical protein DMB37_18585 [Nocardia sp. CS682]